MTVSIQINTNTKFKTLQNFLSEAANQGADQALHGKRNADGSYTLYASKGGGTGASFHFKRSKADRQMNARAAILQVISNYKNHENPEVKDGFDSRFDEVQEFLIKKLNQDLDDKIDQNNCETAPERIDALKDYLISGLPGDLKNAATVKQDNVPARLSAQDVEARLLPELAAQVRK